jgi:hypothetical protein
LFFTHYFFPGTMSPYLTRYSHRPCYWRVRHSPPAGLAGLLAESGCFLLENGWCVGFLEEDSKDQSDLNGPGLFFTHYFFPGTMSPYLTRYSHRPCYWRVRDSKDQSDSGENERDPAHPAPAKILSDEPSNNRAGSLRRLVWWLIW